MALISIALSLLLQPARAAEPRFEQQVPAALKEVRDEISNEDADEASFGIDGAEALPNFHQVTPFLYRSGQPNREGLAKLRDLGVRTILDVRERVSDDERTEIERLGLRLEFVRMNGIFSPSFEQVDRALGIILDPKRQPVLVHCLFGKDRTGVTIAAFRTGVEKASVADAVQEAKGYGCCAPAFKPLDEYLRGFLDQWKLRLGLKAHKR